MSGIVQITEAVATTAHIQCFFFIIIIALLKKKSNHVVSICRWKLRAEKIDWMCVCAVCAGLSLGSLILSLCAFFFLICIHFFWSLCCFSVGLANQLDELFNWILLCVRPSDWTLWNETLSIVANCSRTIRFDERFFFICSVSIYLSARDEELMNAERTFLRATCQATSTRSSTFANQLNIWSLVIHLLLRMYGTAAASNMGNGLVGHLGIVRVFASVWVCESVIRHHFGCVDRTLEHKRNCTINHSERHRLMFAAPVRRMVTTARARIPNRSYGITRRRRRKSQRWRLKKTRFRFDRSLVSTFIPAKTNIASTHLRLPDWWYMPLSFTRRHDEIYAKIWCNWQQ